MFSGDTLFQGGPGATGRSFSDFGTILASIKDKLGVLPSDTVVYTGHGDTTRIGDGSSTTTNGWPGALTGPEPIRGRRRAPGSMRIFAWASGSPSASNAAATPPSPTFPVTRG